MTNLFSVFCERNTVNEVSGRGSAYNGGPGYPSWARKNWEQLALHEAQQDANRL